MKRLLDENLSRKLVIRIAELYPGTIHVSQVNLLRSNDLEIWSYARREGFVIVTTDSDFFDLVTTHGPPPKVIWLREWSHRTRDVEMVLRREAIRIAELDLDPELGLLVLRYSQ